MDFARPHTAAASCFARALARRWENGRNAPDTVILAVLSDLSRIGRTRMEPIVVHCDMGVGRTGVFIAMAHGLWQLEKHNSVDVLGIVAALREDRGGMVPELQQ